MSDATSTSGFGRSMEHVHKNKHRFRAWTFFPIAGISGLAIMNITMRKWPLKKQMPIILAGMAGVFLYSNALSLGAIVEERSHK